MMKKMIIGSIGVLSGVLLYGLTLIASAIYTLYIVAPNGGGYDRKLGVFGSALKEIGTMPLFIGGLFFLVGIFYIIIGIKE
jgi:hypothetical protein